MRSSCSEVILIPMKMTSLYFALRWRPMSTLLQNSKGIFTVPERDKCRYRQTEGDISATGRGS